MTVAASTRERPSAKTTLVVALLIAVFAAAIIDVVIPITIVDIAKTFNVLPGTVSQLDSLIAIASVVTALLLAAFGSRFRYKSVVMMGVLLIAFYSMGLSLAPSFRIAQLIVPLNGIGSVMIVVTAQTFIGNSYPINKKAKAIGWIAAARTLATAVGALVTGFMTGIGGWRSVFLWFMLPTAIFSLIFVFLAFPSNLPQPQLIIRREHFMKGFKQIFSNKSAVACLIGAFFGNAFVFGAAVFEVTFLRQVFFVPAGLAALIGTLVGTALVTVGAIIGGHTVNRVGRKRLTVVAIFLAGFLTLLAYFMPYIIIFLALRWSASILIGIVAAAASNLALEQVPQFRGTMMSLSSAFSGVGTAIGIAFAGTVLNFYTNSVTGFQALGLTVGAFAFGGALVTLFFAKDPLKPDAGWYIPKLKSEDLAS